MPNRLILFVCTGNVCRSPMAEYMLRRALGPESPWETASAGTAAVHGMPASRGAALVMAEIGLDLGAHRSRPVEAAMVDEAAMAVVMTTVHRQHMEIMFPAAAQKIFLLASFRPGGGDIEDPLGFDLDVYRRIRDEMAAAMPELAAFVNKLQIG